MSTWLNAGVPPTQVAEWAGHSVDVLLKIYAKRIDGDADRHRAKIDAALGPPNLTRELGRAFGENSRNEPPTAGDHRTDKNGPSPTF